MRKSNEYCPPDPAIPSYIAKIHRWTLIAACGVAVVLDLVVAWQLSGSMDVVNYHLLAIFAVTYLVDQRRPVPSQYSWGALGIGVFLLASALCKSLLMIKGDDYRHFLALTFAIGLGLVALGFRETFTMPKALVILGTISVFDIPFASAGLNPLHLNELGAMLSANLLLVAGYPAVASGTEVALPTGSVDVFGACSAAVPMLYLLKLTLLVLLVFPSKLWQKMGITSIAIGIAILLNAVRISLMAIMVAAGDHGRFVYWHEGDGSNLFSILYAAAFCCGCMLLLRKTGHPTPKESTV